MSKDKLESLVKRMEETLSEMEQLKLHCGRQSEELSQLVVELRRENQELVEKYNQLAVEMKEAKEIIEQLQDTKYAFNAKERQAQKLSRQLWWFSRRMKTDLGRRKTEAGKGSWLQKIPADFMCGHEGCVREHMCTYVLGLHEGAGCKA